MTTSFSVTSYSQEIGGSIVLSDVFTSRMLQELWFIESRITQELLGNQSRMS
jgi:hypothetical protein